MTTTEASPNRFSGTLSSQTSSVGRGEVELQATLTQLRIECSFPPASRMPLFAFRRGRPFITIPDALIHDIRYGWGCVYVDGSVHSTQGNQAKDEKIDARLEELKVWVERLSPTEARDRDTVTARMESHRRAIDDYGNPY